MNVVFIWNIDYMWFVDANKGFWIADIDIVDFRYTSNWLVVIKIERFALLHLMYCSKVSNFL